MRACCARVRCAALLALLLVAGAAHGAAAQPALCDFVNGNDATTCAVLQALYDSTGGDNWLDNGGWLDAFSVSPVGTPADYCGFTGVTCDSNNEFVLGLDLGFVGLAGTLPPALGLLQNVTDLRLDVNALSGTIPNELTSLTNLELLVLVGNRLSGSLPDELGSLSALTLLRVDNNVLEGSLPASLGSLTSLLLLGLDNNRIAGSLPAELGSLTALESLSAAGNALQGTLPGAALAELTALTYMSLAKNVLSGELPETLGELTGLTLLSLENNALRGSLPGDAIGALTALQYLGLQGNKLNGSLPEALGSLTALRELTLRENAFSGSLPAALGALTQLTYLWLDTNTFSGVLPGGALGALSALTVLTLDSNDLVGALPLELGTLPQLQRLSASNNLLNGSLPVAFSNLTSLRLLSLGGNAGLGGALPVSWAALSSLTALDLSDCAFSGTVPPQWEAGLAALQVLKLSGNAGLGPAPGVLATLPTSPCGSVAEAYDPVRGCVCAPGYSLAAGRECLPCASGTYAAVVGAAACVACPANTYAEPNATGCVACPSGSSSPPGSAVLQSCACLYGTYAVPSADGATFACAPCPANAICTGPDVPLAQTGYWHLPGDHSVFYACAEDKCLAETPGEVAANSSNCVIGRTGNVCGICEEGWAEQDQVCIPCRPSDAFDAWSAGSKAGAVIGALLLFVIVSYVGFLRPLFGGRDAHDPDMSRRMAGHAALAHVTLLSAVLEMVSEPLTIVVESLQIVSSFQRTMHINWPPLYFHIMAKLNIVNFSFLRFPNTACATPAVSFYQELNGITIGVSGALLWIAFLWLSGNVYARIRDIPAATRRHFNGDVMAHTCVFLNIIYAPVSEAVMAVFACRKLGEESWLFRDVATQCYTAEHRMYVKLGIFWVVFYVIGIPAVCIGLLVYFRIPHTATRLRRTAMLRGVIELAWWRGVDQPEDVNTSLVTETNITEEHLDALFAGLRLDSKRKSSLRFRLALAAGRMRRSWAKRLGQLGQAASRSLGRSSDHAAAAAAAEVADGDDPLGDAHAPQMLTRAERLDVLQAWARRNVHLTHFTWDDISGCDDDVRRPGFKSIDHLYVPFYPTRWYFGLLQNVIKLVLTSLLLFIVPGTPAQIVAGLCISFTVLLWYLRLLPYAEKVARQIAYSSYVVIFLFFVLALLLKMNVPVTPDDNAFYGAFCGILVFSLFVFPAVAVLRTGRIKPHHAGASPHSHEDDGEPEPDAEKTQTHGGPAEHLAEALMRTTRKFEPNAFHKHMPTGRVMARMSSNPKGSGY